MTKKRRISGQTAPDPKTPNLDVIALEPALAEPLQLFARARGLTVEEAANELIRRGLQPVVAPLPLQLPVSSTLPRLAPAPSDDLADDADDAPAAEATPPLP